MRYLAALALVVAPALGQDPNRESNSNDTPATADHLRAGDQIDASIDPVGDVDWFRIELTEPRDIRIWTGPGFANAIGDTVIKLQSAQSDLSVTVDDGSRETHGFYSILTIGDLPAGVYHIEVSGYPGPPASTGEYTLDYIAAPVGTFALQGPLRPGFEGGENNDPRLGGSSAISLLGTRNQGSLHSGGGGISLRSGPEDYDFFRIQVTTPGQMTLETKPGSGLAIQDTVLFLMDTQFNILAQNDNISNTSLYSRIIYDAPVGTYLAVVKGFLPGDGGSYVLEILGPPTIPPSRATVELRAPRCALDVRLEPRRDPLFPQAHAEAPLVGSTFCLDFVGDDIPDQPIILALIAPVSNPGLPISHYGLTTGQGCVSEVDPGLSTTTLLEFYGELIWRLRIPESVALVGANVEAQAGVIDRTLNSLTMTNRVTLHPGRSH